jgi:hypothetical protein
MRRQWAKMKQTKTIKIDYMTHKELVRLQKEQGFKRIGSVIQYLLNLRTLK